MNAKTDFSVVLTIVNRGYSDDVVDAAISSGAKGSTIILARGTGRHETDTFFGVPILPEKEIVMTLVPEDRRADIMRAIVRKAGLDTEGQGITFSLPVNEVAGIAHLTEGEKEKFDSES